MLTQRNRPIVFALAAIVGIWLLAVAGYQLALSFKMTADKVRAYEESVDFSKLTGADRENALRKLEAMLNALTLEERNKVWGDIMKRWFAAMTEAEKEAFLEATLPTNFKQTITAFENMPPERKQRTIDNALKNLQDQADRLQAGGSVNAGTGLPGLRKSQGTNQPPLSSELQDKIKSIGLKSYYSQSSAETKAQLAPVLEEMQNVMELSRKNNAP
jgi:hypothetical protein